MPDIDYEALATAGHDAYFEGELGGGVELAAWCAVARAVVAAYVAQQQARGVEWVNSDDLDVVMQCYDDDWATAAYNRIRANRAAPEPAEDANA